MQPNSFPLAADSPSTPGFFAPVLHNLTTLWMFFGQVTRQKSKWTDIIKIPGSNEPRARRNTFCLKVGVFGHDPLQPLGEKPLYVETSGTVWARRGGHGEEEEAVGRPLPSSPSSRSIAHPTCPQKPLNAVPWQLQSLPTRQNLIYAPRLRVSTLHC